MRPLLLALAVLGLSLVTGCKTTNSNGYNYNKSHEAYGSDGPVHAPSGRSQQVRNAFSSFQY